MTADDYFDDQERKQALIRNGICPDCGYPLDMPHPSHNIFMPNMTERQCYECHEVFYVGQED